MYFAKLFYTFGKTPLRETGCLSNLYYLLAVNVFSFLIYFLWLTGHHAMPGVTTLISSFINFVTYGIPYCARGHHSHFPNQPIPRGQRVSLGVASILIASTHILSLNVTSKNNSEAIFIYVKNMNIFTCGEKISKFAVSSSLNHLSKKIFPQKIYFQNYSLKK